MNRIKHARTHALAGCLAMVVLWASASPANNVANAPYYLSSWLEQPQMVFDTTVISTEPLRNFYSKYGYAPMWVDGNGLTPRATKALAVIANAETQGLNPELYHLSTIKSIQAMPRGDSDTATRINLSLELLMSNAVIHYATDMHGGVVRPQWDTGAQTVTTTDQVTFLTQATSTQDTAAYLTAMAPQSHDYQKLQASLQQYQAITRNGGWPAFAVGKTIKPGMDDPRLPTLRQILMVTGDLAPNTTITHPTQYDAATVEAVKRFQERHGLNNDGAIGTATQNALAVPASQRVSQIAMTMERMRWMPNDMGSRYVLVNVPAYSLTAVSGADQLKMKVIVGKPATRTPMFSKQITDVVLNPSWGVPSRIAVNEFLPKLKKDPSYLIRGGYTVVDTSGGGAREIDPYSVDWQSQDRSNFTYSFRQKPGEGNALGKVKFNIPNSDNIYLHDTAQPALFSRAERSLSHGCIRLGDPKALTEFVLSHEGWDEAKIDATYDSRASRSIAITPLPVHLVYWTSWVDDTGRIRFSQDIYGMDKKLQLAMEKSIKPAEETIKLALN